MTGVEVIIEEDELTEDEFFMGIAILAFKRSEDLVRKVGACIVNQNEQVVGIGFNAFLCGSEKHPWHDEELYVAHAEMHAIIDKLSNDLKNCTIYVTFFSM